MYIEIDDDLYNGFDDELKGQLKPYEPEDTSGLKDKANQLLSEKKTLEAQVAEAQADIKKLKVNPPQGADAEKLQSQLDDAMAKIKTSQEQYEGLQGQIKTEKRNSEAMKLASELTRDNKRANLLAEKIANRIDIDNGSVVVLDHNGNPTVSSVKDLQSAMKSEYDFLVDGSQASGGGAQGGGGGAAKANTLKRSDFDSMDQKQRSDFAKSGGKVVND